MLKLRIPCRTDQTVSYDGEVKSTSVEMQNQAPSGLFVEINTRMDQISEDERCDSCM